MHIFLIQYVCEERIIDMINLYFLTIDFSVGNELYVVSTSMKSWYQAVSSCCQQGGYHDETVVSKKSHKQLTQSRTLVDLCSL